ncbi:MAG: ABC transporter permease [Rhodospirillales bacterium]
MWAYALKRIVLAVPTLLLVALLVFILMRMVPGDPAAMMLGVDNPDAVADLRRRLGLDRSYPEQFLIWLGNLLQGDLGTSLMTGEPVLDGMLRRFAVTAQVVVLAMLLAALIAIPGGLLAAWAQNSLTDYTIVFVVIVGLSIPSFWAGLILVMIFGVWLQWLPAVGYVSPFVELGDGLLYLLMPVAALVIVEMATILRMTRSSTIEVLRLEYVTHARAKGLSEATVMLRHVFKNAFAPTMTLLGLIVGSLLGGAVVIESVFSLPGLGRFLVDAIYARDYPVVQGCLLLVAVIYVVVNLIVDLLYPVLDPRVTFQ